MTRDDIIRMAREVGLEQTISIAPDNSSRIVFCPPIEPLERLATLAYEAGRKDENEAIADAVNQCDARATPKGIAAAIRARREQ